MTDTVLLQDECDLVGADGRDGRGLVTFANLTTGERILLDEFDHDAWVNLADEFDPMGADPDHPAELGDFDPMHVRGATRFAKRWGLPLPWNIGSLDIALELMHNALSTEGYGKTR